MPHGAIPFPSEVDALAPISQALDAASHDERVAWMRAMPMRDFWKLWDLAEGNAVDVGYFTYEDGRPRIHHGANTAPPFRSFQKRFARLGEQVVGYNHPVGLGTAVVWFQGYGPFLLAASSERAGEAWVDYRELPAQHPDFPPVRPNTGTRGLVYGGMIDVVRRVANDVTIGDTWKKSFPVGIGAKFVLCREA